MSEPVQFVNLTQSEYDNLIEKKDSRLYFTNDTHRLYKGDVLFSTNYNPLNGKSYDLSNNNDLYQALSDIINAFGGQATYTPQ